jgi:hypothetical protein
VWQWPPPLFGVGAGDRRRSSSRWIIDHRSGLGDGMTSIGADCVPLVGDLGVPVACMSWVIDPGSDEGKCILVHRNVGLILTLQS